MATETQTGLSGHMRGVTVTTLACLAGVAAALASGALLGLGSLGPEAISEAAKSQQTLAVLGASILAQFPVLRVVGVDISDFGAKDYLYVVFMTFTLWFISFGILLTSGASL